MGFLLICWFHNVSTIGFSCPNEAFPVPGSHKVPVPYVCLQTILKILANTIQFCGSGPIFSRLRLMLPARGKFCNLNKKYRTGSVLKYEVKFFFRYGTFFYFILGKNC